MRPRQRVERIQDEIEGVASQDMTTICPICSTVTDKKVAGTPYWRCGNCEVWFQSPPPPKLYHGIHEGIPGVMSEGDRQVNRNLAGYLFREVMGGKAGPIVDIGASLPVLASTLADLGCDATVIDGDPVPHEFTNVAQLRADFETLEPPELPPYDLAIMIHSYEHLYDPCAAMHKLRDLVNLNGHVFLRLPQQDVEGFSRDLTPGHYAVHPFYHCLSSMLEVLKQTETFKITGYSPMVGYGQADFVMTPLP